MERHNAAAITALLDEWSIAYQSIEHPAVGTMEDCLAIDKELNAPVCKNLFLQNRQGTRYYLLLTDGKKQFHTAQVSKALGVSRLSFGTADALERLLGVSPGAVSPLGLVFDTENEVTLLIDSVFRGCPALVFHPCVNTSSLRLSGSDFFSRFLPAAGHTPVWLDLPADQ
ncbi:MAG: prolyl-tRNA synthetase associated domain-containing protein [Eubacteriales bacterium]|nr:prolyl-tRNA synthetase associated domain-containing protein [Eubacteriales bacterium]